MLKKDAWQRRSAKLLFAFFALLMIYIAFKYALGVLLPILFAWAIGASVYGLAQKSEKALYGKQRLWSIFYVAVFWCFLFVGLLAVIAKAIGEASDLLDYLASNGDQIIQSIGDTIESIVSIPSRLPFLKKFADNDMAEKAEEYIGKALSAALTAITQKGSSALANGVGILLIGTPKAAISLLVCIMASIYIALDYGKIKEYFSRLTSQSAKEQGERIFARISKGLRGYLRAYFFLFLITFTQLYAGLFFLKRRYAFVIALAVAALDLLPLFGSGVVLVPWSIVLIAGGSYNTGIGMLMLFGVMTVVRQIAEPRLVGGSLGIHPLASLVSMFVGLRLFGFWGMLLAPIGVLVVKELLEERKAKKNI